MQNQLAHCLYLFVLFCVFFVMLCAQPSARRGPPRAPPTNHNRVAHMLRHPGDLLAGVRGRGASSSSSLLGDGRTPHRSLLGPGAATPARTTSTPRHVNDHPPSSLPPHSAHSHASHSRVLRPAGPGRGGLLPAAPAPGVRAAVPTSSCSLLGAPGGRSAAYSKPSAALLGVHQGGTVQ